MGKIKPWEELSFQDDYMFKRVMSHKRFCKRMLEKILRLEIRDICYLEDEKTIKTAYESKGIRIRNFGQFIRAISAYFRINLATLSADIGIFSPCRIV